MGFCGSAYNWIKCFLIGRTQRVKVGNSLSVEQNVISGVPQGTVLSPLLFICFSADILNVVNHSVISMYADDTKLYKKITSNLDCCLLQTDLDNIFQWANIWQLQLNPDKTNVICIGKRKFCYDFMLSNKIIERVDQICDIGIYIQSNLKFTSHCNNVIKKAHYVIRNIFNTFKHHDISFYMHLYKVYVRPILESNTQIWSPCLKFNIDNVESVQRYFTRRLPGLRGVTYVDRLFGLNLETLEARRIKSDLLLCYKVIHGFTKLNLPRNSFHIVNSPRGHIYHLFYFFLQLIKESIFGVIELYIIGTVYLLLL